MIRSIGTRTTTRAWHALVMASTAGMLGLGLAACGGNTSAKASTTAPGLASAQPTRPAAPNWSDYIIARKGRSCTSAYSTKSGSAKVTTDLTDSVVSVTKAPDGVQFDRRISATSTDGKHGAPRPVLPATDHSYVLANNGTLEVVPGSTAQPPITVAWNGAEVYPTIQHLEAGSSSISNLTLSVSSTDPATRRQLLASVAPGATAQRLQVGMKLSAAPVRTRISTPAGVFTDLVGVRTRLVGIRAFNAKPGSPSQDAGLIGMLTSAMGDTDVYFARGVGEVLAIGSGTTAPLLRCTG